MTNWYSAYLVQATFSQWSVRQHISFPLYTRIHVAGSCQTGIASAAALMGGLTDHLHGNAASLRLPPQHQVSPQTRTQPSSGCACFHDGGHHQGILCLSQYCHHCRSMELSPLQATREAILRCTRSCRCMLTQLVCATDISASALLNRRVLHTRACVQSILKGRWFNNTSAQNMLRKHAVYAILLDVLGVFVEQCGIPKSSV